jgi:hypothetical protein
MKTRSSNDEIRLRVSVSGYRADSPGKSAAQSHAEKLLETCEALDLVFPVVTIIYIIIFSKLCRLGGSTFGQY